MSRAWNGVLLLSPALMAVQFVTVLTGEGNAAECAQYADYAIEVFGTTSPDVFTADDREALVGACVSSGARDIPKCFSTGMSGEAFEACVSEERLAWLAPSLLQRVAACWPEWEEPS